MKQVIENRTPLQRLLWLGGMVKASGGKLSELTASGNPCVFETNVARPLKRLSLSLLPRQSGTGDPSPENIRPLLPWGEVGTWHGGKNLLNPNFDDWKKTRETRYRYINGVVPEGTTARFTLEVKDASVDISGCYIGFVAENLEETDPQNFIWVVHNGAVQSNMSNLSPSQRLCRNVFVYPQSLETFQKLFGRFNIMVEIGEQATAYEPYTPITPHPVNLQKNLVKTKDSSRESAGITYTVNDDGSVKAYGTTPENATSWFRAGTDYETQGTFLKKGTYRLTGGKTNDKLLYIVGKYVDGTTISNQTVTGGVYDRGEGLTFTLTDDAYITYQIQIRKGFSIDDTFYPMIRLANNGDDTFQPYLPPVYGCSVDLTTGEVWGTHALWTKNTSTMDNAETHPGWKNSGVKDIIGSNVSKVITTTANVGNKINVNTNGNNDIVFLPTSTYGKDQTEWKALAIDVQVAFPLATPVLLATLTAQQINALVGVNTVWSDADGIELTYLKKG